MGWARRGLESDGSFPKIPGTFRSPTRARVDRTGAMRTELSPWAEGQSQSALDGHHSEGL